MADVARLLVSLDSFAYPDGTVALADIRLAVGSGDFLALLGANGSGKTTLLKLLDGLIRDYKGSVLLDGADILKQHPKEIYRKMGLVFQNPDDQLFAHSVSEDVAFGPRNMGFDDSEVNRRVLTALAQVEMDGTGPRNIHHLSYGQKKRVCIAGLLAMGHEILLLDEPTAGLDPVGEQRMLELLANLNRDHGVTIIMATHAVDLAPLFVKRLAILDKGRLAAVGTPQELLADPAAMAAVRLRLPQVAELFWQLRHEDGFPPGPLPLGIVEARREIVAMHGHKEKK
ncbi:putative ABC transporter ATP-binding protein [Geobacter sp. OR-1]|uniref:energy-coupling factor ABC transporter ATP-binding protein n=1 Tax=Geobacter sp. OR-1 TaxID=1266765 RepID=UPI000542F718|nr:ATP-binding cassette domain-containing protein [Geobacter sp. OR-1]GAM09630.1 putative ABC transporter ATP-binding protein [Geobacter sp. OR-1]